MANESTYQNLIEQRVRQARDGKNRYVITKMRSGWLVVGDVQPLDGYCLLLADPVVPSINALNEADRMVYWSDVSHVGDALLAVTRAKLINYETWGNSEPALHTHIMPRYEEEDEHAKTKPACMSYSWTSARPYEPERDGPFINRMREFLASD